MSEATKITSTEMLTAWMNELCDLAVRRYARDREEMLNAWANNTKTVSLRELEPVVLHEMIAEHACNTRQEALDLGYDIHQLRQRLEELRGDLVRELTAPQTNGAPDGFGHCPVEFPSLIGHVERELRCESCRKWIEQLDVMIDWARQGAKSE